MAMNAPSDKRYNALLVDDEPAILTVLTQVLEDEGFIVSTATSGEEAVRVLKTKPFDVIMTDIRMQGISGFELIEHVESVDSAVKTIVMTGYDSYDMVKRALRTGAYDYLSKPLDEHEVIKLCANRAAQATRMIRDNAELVEQIRASHTMLEQANDKLRVLNEELRIQANTDSLTEIYNRRFLDQSIASEVTRRNRYPDPLSVAMIDVDHFKLFNDQHGHEGGDVVLQAISKILTDCARNTDVVGRYGGEEFMVVLPKTSPENALLFAERVRLEIAMNSIMLSEVACGITVSVGVSGIDEKFPDVTANQLVGAADRALYSAKESGRDCIRFQPLAHDGHDMLKASSGF